PGASANGKGYDPAGAIKIAHITDGTCNTIVIAEKYPTCFNSNYSKSAGEGGSYWAYAALSSNPPLPAPNQGSSANPTTPKPVFPGFAISFYTSLTGGGAAVGYPSRFQSRPFPFDSGTTCDPALAQTPHADMMPVCMADCTVRTIS